MAAEILNGKLVADKLISKISEKISQRVEKGHQAPGLAVVLVGDDIASGGVPDLKGLAAFCGNPLAPEESLFGHEARVLEEGFPVCRIVEHRSSPCHCCRLRVC